MLSICQTLFPGRSPTDLSADECRQLVLELYRTQAQILRVATTPELAERILRELPFKARESLRRVCHLWNRVIIWSRTREEFEAINPTRQLLHIALELRDPRYLTVVQTQEEFDRLWPNVTAQHYYVYRFLGPDKVQQAYRMVNPYISGIMLWLTRIPYRALRNLRFNIPKRFIREAAACLRVKTHTRGRYIDPRLIVELGRRIKLETLGWHMLSIDYEEQGFVSDNYHEPLIHIFPELGLYLYLYSTSDRWRDLYSVPDGIRNIPIGDLPLEKPTAEEYLHVWNLFLRLPEA
jgi:hypothetical protein